MAFATFANILNANTISFDISDDESDCDRGTASVRTLLLIRRQQQQQPKRSDSVVQAPARCIAGSKRVSNYCEKNGLLPPSSCARTQVLQSITAIPALADQSFEEIRVECYKQCVVATGKPPQAVDASSNPSAVIPPLFIPVRDEGLEELESEAVMLDVW
ncbi:hypothetical protein AX17_007123 [Amanita inopinata Kibby_2008]|nr:hypothetical protein AX17_007123 [Amanita inopinata Kibby_2008]